MEVGVLYRRIRCVRLPLLTRAEQRVLLSSGSFTAKYTYSRCIVFKENIIMIYVTFFYELFSMSIQTQRYLGPAELSFRSYHFLFIEGVY